MSANSLYLKIAGLSNNVMLWFLFIYPIVPGPHHGYQHLVLNFLFKLIPIFFFQTGYIFAILFR